MTRSARCADPKCRRFIPMRLKFCPGCLERHYANVARPARVIFLDFDGVIVDREWFTGPPGKRRERAGTVNPRLVAKLNEIVVRTGAEIVVSSSWRYGRSVDQLERILRSAGFIGRVMGSTPTRGVARGVIIEGERRGGEISQWITDTRWTGAYVVLDDDTDIGPHASRFVHTSFDLGLTDDDVSRACELFAEAPAP